MANNRLLSTIGVELDWSSDVRKRIQESSYIQEQYILTRCSLSSERSLQTQSHSHIHASNSDGSFLSSCHCSGPVLDTGSLPQGLEKMPPPEQRSSLSRWADSSWQQDLSVKSPDSGTKKVRLKTDRLFFWNLVSNWEHTDKTGHENITTIYNYKLLSFLWKKDHIN